MNDKRFSDVDPLLMQKRFDYAVSLAGSQPKACFVQMLALAEEGFTPAKNDVAGYYYQGIGCEQDSTQAVRWYGEAWQDGDALAGLNLAQHKLYGIGTVADANGSLRICLDVLSYENDYHDFAVGLLNKAMNTLEKPSMVDLNALLSKFINLMNSGNNDQALIVISKAIEKYPSLWGLYKNRAVIRSHMDDYAGAKADLNIAIALNPNERSLYEMRWMMRFNLHDPNAQEDLERFKQM